MPENVEVCLTADRLRSKLVTDIKGPRRFHGITIEAESKYGKTGILPGGKYISDLDQMNITPNGTTVYNMYRGTFISVINKGKKIFIKIKLDNGKEIYLISFLGMEGHWVYNKQKYSTITLHLGTLKKLGRVKMDISDENIYYDDSCKFGFLKVLGTQEELNSELNVIGPDYLSGSVSLQMFKSKIQSPRITNKSITSFLLEQKWFSGIGNYIKSEVLWLSGISPVTTSISSNKESITSPRIIGSLSECEIETLYNAIMEVMNESYSKGGLTISTYKGPNGELGLYEPLVYKRKFDKFNHPIIAEKIGDDRNTYYCPICQK